MPAAQAALFTHLLPPFEEEVFMNDIRRTILWVIFGFSMVLLWDQWQVYNGNKPTFFPGTPVPPAATAGAAAGAASVPARQAGRRHGRRRAPRRQAPPAAPAGAAPAAGAKFPVTTDLLRMTFDTEGGSLVRTELLKQAERADKTGTFVLLDDGPGRKYVAETGLIGGDFPNHKTVMTFSGERELKAGANELVREVRIARKGRRQAGQDLHLQARRLRRGGAPRNRQHRRGAGGAAAVPAAGARRQQAVGRIVVLLHLHRAGGVHRGQKFQKMEFADIEKGKVDIQKESTNGWVAMVQHYFASAWILPDGVKRENYSCARSTTTCTRWA